MGDLRQHMKSRRALRIQWLCDHPEQWEGWIELSHGGDRRRIELVKQMQAAGVVSRKTYPPDVKLTHLIHEARRRLRAARLDDRPARRRGEG